MKPAEVTELLQALNDGSVSQRQRAARNLGNVDPAELTDAAQVTKALEAASQDKNKYIRMAAAGALLRLAGDNSRAHEVFQELLEDEHRDVRSAALAALGNLGSAAKSLLPAVKAALKDPHEAVKQHAGAALKKIQQS